MPVSNKLKKLIKRLRTQLSFSLCPDVYSLFFQKNSDSEIEPLLLFMRNLGYELHPMIFLEVLPRNQHRFRMVSL